MAMQFAAAKVLRLPMVTVVQELKDRNISTQGSLMNIKARLTAVVTVHAGVGSGSGIVPLSASDGTCVAVQTLCAPRYCDDLIPCNAVLECMDTAVEARDALGSPCVATVASTRPPATIEPRRPRQLKWLGMQRDETTELDTHPQRPPR